MPAPTGLQSIRVWDLPLRIFHWSLLVCVTGAIVSIEFLDNIDWHQRFGYAVLALVLFRIAWGFVGGRHARFANFVRGPAGIAAYLRGTGQKAIVSIGHNPLGALSVLALLLVLTMQAGSGLFLTDEILFEAPLYKFVSGETASLLAWFHALNANVLFALIGLHLAAIVFYRVVKRDTLILPMITGRKKVPAQATAEADRGGSAGVGLIVLAIAIAVVWFVTTRL